MSILRIHLFGGLDVYRGDRPLAAFPTERSRSLFAFLALNRTRLYPREVLAGVLWGEQPEDSARKGLRTALWRVRAVVDEEGSTASALAARGGKVGLDPAVEHWVDVEEFERRVRTVPSPRARLGDQDAAVLRGALALYRGDLLDGMYDDWCLYERERLRLLFVATLERLMRHEEECGRWNQALSIGERLIDCDPLLEHVHRSLMRCHLRQGDRAAALRQYERCADLLHRELDVEPMRETRALHAAIRDAGDAPADLPLGESGTAALQRAGDLLQRVERSLQELYGITRELERTAQSLRDARPVPDAGPEAPEPWRDAGRTRL